MKLWRWFAVALLAGCLAAPAAAQYGEASKRLVEASKRPYGYEKVDWQNRRYEVMAVGAYDREKALTKGRERTLARDIAVTLARERLLMAAMGTRVMAGRSLVRYSEDVNYELSARFLAYGVLENVNVDSVQYYEHEDDGSLYAVAHVSAPMVSLDRLREIADSKGEIDTEIDRIWNAVGLEGQPKPPKAQIRETRRQVGQVIRQSLAAEQAGLDARKADPAPGGVSGQYTGLIVDARHLVEATMTNVPRVVTPSLRRVYGHEDVPRAVHLNGNLVAYTSNPEEVAGILDDRDTPLVGSRPLTVTAVGARPDDPGHLVVSEADGSRVITAGSGVQGFLRQGRVVFVF